jgi:hypothetical protein
MKNLYSFEYDELDCKKIFTEEEIFYPIRYLEKTDLTLSLYRIPVLNILTLFLLIIISFKHRLYLYRKQEITNG